MNVLAINGSPRKNWNTAMLLEHALAGAASKGAATELVHLYGLDFKGCTSCFSCKLKGGSSYEKCAMRDGLTPLLEKLVHADAFILGSPIYLCLLFCEAVGIRLLNHCASERMVKNGSV